MKNDITEYFKDTKSLLYSFLFSLPLFLTYELLILIAQPDPTLAVRVSVDVWFKSIFTSLNLNAISWTLTVAVILGFIILFKEREKLRTLRFRYFPILIAESLVYAIVTALIANFLVNLVFAFAPDGSIQTLSVLQKFALSLGAGLYEELFFRVILVTALIWVFDKVFKEAKWASITSSVVLSALLFSLVHYIGQYGDPFTLSSFSYRFIFGLLLNGLYVWRGFGVAAWTHALYDIIVLLIIN